MKLIVQTLQKINWAHLDLESDLESRGLLNAEIEVETLYFLEMNLKITFENLIFFQKFFIYSYERARPVGLRNRSPQSQKSTLDDLLFQN